MAVSGWLVRSEGAKFILFPWAFAMIGSCAATKMFSGSVRDAGNGLLVSGIDQAQLDPRPPSQPVMCPHTWGDILTIFLQHSTPDFL